jgi:hypothetical protein
MLRKTLIEGRVWECLSVLFGENLFQAEKMGRWCVRNRRSFKKREKVDGAGTTNSPEAEVRPPTRIRDREDGRKSSTTDSEPEWPTRMTRMKKGGSGALRS